jgi:hypothetical protein
VKQQQKPRPHILIQFLGWYGAGALMTAFLLVSLQTIKPNSFAYELLNLSGALGLLTLGLNKHVRQTVVINIFWVAIAIIALVRLIFR